MQSFRINDDFELICIKQQNPRAAAGSPGVIICITQLNNTCYCLFIHKQPVMAPAHLVEWGFSITQAHAGYINAVSPVKTELVTFSVNANLNNGEYVLNAFLAAIL